ncbi:MAG: hypothetical protein J6Q28_06115 [Alistipes sp.]|nr:hypothetical protein [Alistipes sp.]
MKKLYILLMAGALLSACTNDTPTIQGFSTDMSNIEAAAVGGEYQVTISSDREWVAKANAPWVLISPANGRGEVKCSIKIDSALKNDARETKVSITSMGEELKSINIVQEGFPRSINIEDNEVRIAASAAYANRWVELDVETNVEFEIKDAPAWIIVEDEYELTLDRGARPRKTRIHFDWKMNSNDSERVATLNLVPKDGEALATPATITVRQAAGPRIEDNRQGDSLAVITISEKMECWSDNGISTTEGMHRWDCIRLWEANDAGLPAPEAVGRVRDLDISYFNTEEGVPEEIKHLKYLETLSLYGNVNTMIKSIDLCPEIATLAYLKDLRIAAMGVVSLPDNFAELGDTLESLDLSSNNLNEIPEVINKENFPHLRALDLIGNHRASISDLRKRSSADENGIGLYVNMRKSDAVRKLLLWEELEALGLSYNFIEGELPDFKVGEEGVRAYYYSDIKGDTLKWAVERALPRILPNMKALRINLNFMTGKLPDWLLYHPYLMEWGAEVLIYPQLEKAIDSEGNSVGFENVPTNYEYYFEAYPDYRGRYEFNEEMEE